MPLHQKATMSITRWRCRDRPIHGHVRRRTTPSHYHISSHPIPSERQFLVYTSLNLWENLPPDSPRLVYNCRQSLHGYPKTSGRMYKHTVVEQAKHATECNTPSHHFPLGFHTILWIQTQEPFSLWFKEPEIESAYGARRIQHINEKSYDSCLKISWVTAVVHTMQHGHTHRHTPASRHGATTAPERSCRGNRRMGEVLLTPDASPTARCS